MKITKSSCDQCGKETLNTGDSPGWITITTYTEGHQIGFWVSREPGQYKAKKEATRYDFCKSACLIDFLTKLKR